MNTETFSYVACFLMGVGFGGLAMVVWACLLSAHRADRKLDDWIEEHEQRFDLPSRPEAIPPTGKPNHNTK